MGGEDLRGKVWILPVFTSQFEYLRGFVFVEKRQHISNVAKLCILTDDKRIKGILTLRNEFHENSRFFGTEGVNFNTQKTMRFSLRLYIYIIYRIVLIHNYKRTYDQTDQIEK